MQTLQKILDRVSIPPMVPMIRNIPDDSIPDVKAAVVSAMNADESLGRAVTPGKRIAVAVGSRGIANLPLLVRTVVAWFQAKEAAPFIVPAMGSHGGATAEGQLALLADLGVTEDSTGCSIRSSMEVVPLGTLPNGLGIYFDRTAHEEADGVFMINRIKGHTNFRGKWESGLVKMLAIGLGKHVGADSCHTYGFETMAGNIPAMAAVSLQKVPVLGGLAVVENSLDKVCLVEVLNARNLLERDAELLRFAKTRMPSLPCDQLDVLIVDEMGKDISGAGMDPNVLGRYSVPHMSGGPSISRIVVLNLTDASHGNSIGMGLADFTTYRFRDAINHEAAYINSLTSTATKGSYTPLVLPTDRDAIRGAIKTSNVPDMEKLRMMRIKNTLELLSFSVTPVMVNELEEQGCAVVGPAGDLAFTAEGQLRDHRRNGADRPSAAAFGNRFES